MPYASEGALYWLFAQLLEVEVVEVDVFSFGAD